MMQRHTPPSLEIRQGTPTSAHACGTWVADLLTDEETMMAINEALDSAEQQQIQAWDISSITALDHIGAQILWRSWGKRLPPQLVMKPAFQGLFQRLLEFNAIPDIKPSKRVRSPLGYFGQISLNFALHIIGITQLLGQLLIDLMKFARHPLKGPWKEISANVFRTGFQALGITAIVGMLIGVVLSYLSGQQLRNYGGDLFIVNLLGISIVRELGPMLAAILIAGRSGSAITAQLGVMKVTEELDAMRVMGIPIGFRLIMPKVIALAFTMPMIVIWTDIMALIGGAISAQVLLDMSPAFFFHKLPDAVSLANYWIGLGKGAVFGVLISLVACHYGLRIKPNTESLGQGTTSSVVISITSVIVADAIFAVIFSNVGY
jgi:phospholipid/cholesterol/gamma-HCH transport system permease protein